MDKFSYLSNADPTTLDSLYQQYLADPTSVSLDWARFFEGFDLASARFPQKPGANGSHATATAATRGYSDQHVQQEISVLNLIAGYRTRGHLFANINPILPRKEYQPPLDLSQFGLSVEALDTVFQAGEVLGMGPSTLRQILEHLEETYCGKVGVEYMYARIPAIVKWFQERMEPTRNRPNYPSEKKYHILRKLGQANTFEAFLHKKFVGQKRFSLEGAEALIPALDGIIEHGAQLGIEEFVIGMAHRGRLNVLTNIMQKEYDVVFGEFEGKGVADDVFDGDVKYHMGFSSDVRLAFGDQVKHVHLSLQPNPSHLEAVNPVVLGAARAKMDQLYEGDHNRICPILIHGDASVAGQGIGFELIQMSRLRGYEVGGAVHIVVNNQVGFTTDEKDARSSTYCSDVAKVTLSPVFHVNGDDAEAVVYVTQLAIEFRQRFNRDVFIDIVCYRKYGHNEGDEPRFTQPRMYVAIAKHKDPFALLAERYLAEKSLTQAQLDALNQQLADNLDKELEESKAHQADAPLNVKLQRIWEGIEFYNDHQLEADPDTRVKRPVLDQLAKQLAHIPEGFEPHRNIQKLFEQRGEMLKNDAVDWGMAELMAYGSLLLEGYPVRMTGQDVERGTFSHRHAVITDQNTGMKYIALNGLAEPQPQFMIHNSLLSEFAVMGFEYGYASAAPKTLTLWEAQFGDFVNGAQIIIDQFLSACKTKWQRMNGLVLLLPHGYEGQGPEHSSARMERFLTLCAENNMFVCNITNPANFFHALRRQLLTPYRRPLVVFTPKSLLRLPAAVSKADEFTKNRFRPLIDSKTADPKQVTRIVLCSGKIYYDLKANQLHHAAANVALVRLEQLYPLPTQAILDLLAKYKKAKEVVWCQEEPENMGPWPLIARKMLPLVPHLQVVARKESASPATGSISQHTRQQHYLVRKALNLAPDAEIAYANNLRPQDIFVDTD
ncbi:MAG: 2-oxoglutarate dehydrogenase E1 component [Bacteroidia bacterium]|nr:2-oxoglutarate dehydrogenase E1 component [Bacteroidia bacterium]